MEKGVQAIYNACGGQGLEEYRNHHLAAAQLSRLAGRRGIYQQKCRRKKSKSKFYIRKNIIQRRIKLLQATADMARETVLAENDQTF